MILERLRQNPGIKREHGVHGRILLQTEKDSTYIYTLESPWDFNKDEPNGIVGISCINEGDYKISIEKSPIDNLEYPFIYNPKLNVQLRNKEKAIDRTGHAFVHKTDAGLDKIYGRYILIGAHIRYDPTQRYEPINGGLAMRFLLDYIKETKDTNLTIKWVDR